MPPKERDFFPTMLPRAENLRLSLSKQNLLIFEFELVFVLFQEFAQILGHV